MYVGNVRLQWPGIGARGPVILESVVSLLITRLIKALVLASSIHFYFYYQSVRGQRATIQVET